MPIVMSRSSSGSSSRSSRACGSRNTARASSNETRCLAKLARALSSSHSKCSSRMTVTSQIRLHEAHAFHGYPSDRHETQYVWSISVAMTHSPARTAAWLSPTTETSAQATRSSASKWRSLRGSCDQAFERQTWRRRLERAALFASCGGRRGLTPPLAAVPTVSPTSQPRRPDRHRSTRPKPWPLHPARSSRAPSPIPCQRGCDSAPQNPRG